MRSCILHRIWRRAWPRPGRMYRPRNPLKNLVRGPSHRAMGAAAYALREWLNFARVTAMIRLPEAVRAWGTPDFSGVLTRLLKSHAGQLPMQKGLATSNYAFDDGIDLMIIAAAAHFEYLRVTAGVFYSGIVAGCSCADDPTPVEAQPEYCVVQVDIDKITAETRIRLVPD